MTFHGRRSSDFLEKLVLQERNDWCWAAALSTLYSFVNVTLSQKMILRQSGVANQVNQGGQAEHVNMFFGIDIKSRNGMEYRISTKRFRQLPPIDDLKIHFALNPALAGFHMIKEKTLHMVVVTGIEIQDDAVIFYEVLDPLTENIRGYHSNEIVIKDFWLPKFQRKIF